LITHRESIILIRLLLNKSNSFSHSTMRVQLEQSKLPPLPLLTMNSWQLMILPYLTLLSQFGKLRSMLETKKKTKGKGATSGDNVEDKLPIIIKRIHSNSYSKMGLSTILDWKTCQSTLPFFLVCPCNSKYHKRSKRILRPKVPCFLFVGQQPTTTLFYLILIESLPFFFFGAESSQRMNQTKWKWRFLRIIKNKKFSIYLKKLNMNFILLRKEEEKEFYKKTFRYPM
jgi:hypothetical protein